VTNARTLGRGVCLALAFASASCDRVGAPKAVATATATVPVAPAPAPVANHAFVRVTECETDFGDVDFCDAAHRAAIESALHTRRADFAGHWLVVTVPGTAGDEVSVVVVDTRTGMALPLPFDTFGDYTDERGFPVAAPPRRIEYAVDGDRICFHGSVYAYRNTYTSMTSCYRFRPDDRQFPFQPEPR
jgi:hypothetical protein